MLGASGTAQGAPWLEPAPVQSARCAVRRKATYRHGLSQRLKARRGAGKVIVAVAAAMPRAISVMLERGAAYRDLGPDHLQRPERSRLAARLARKLDELGFGHPRPTRRRIAVSS